MRAEHAAEQQGHRGKVTQNHSVLLEKADNRHEATLSGTTKRRGRRKKGVHVCGTNYRETQSPLKKVRNRERASKYSGEAGTGKRSPRSHAEEEKNRTLRRGLLGCDMGQNRSQEASIRKTGMGLRINKR